MCEAPRTIPVKIRRQLRQESLFGCAYCGVPILDYHHIVPWSERKDHVPADMVALCPLHHRIVAKMRQEEQYRIKSNPHNRSTNKLYGLLATQKDIRSVRIGTNIYHGAPIVLSYYDFPMVSFRVEDGQFLLSVYVPRSDFWPELKIIDNDVTVWTDDLWDFEFRTDYLKMMRRDDDQFLEVNLRRDMAEIFGRFLVDGLLVSFSREEISIGNQRYWGNTYEGCGTAISVGDRSHRLVPPNYAMLVPRALLISN